MNQAVVEKSPPETMGLKIYLIIVMAYWAFTITDGAIHMLVVLHFHQMGFSPLKIAFLFLFYEIFGIITNGLGGLIASSIGLNRTMIIGGFMQVGALAMLAVDPSFLTVTYVMVAMAFSGIAKDLNKMSAKSSVKLLVAKDANARLFKWVAILTGSKNALKGAGFFIGGALLYTVGFQIALLIFSIGLFVVYILAMVLLPQNMGISKAKSKLSQLFSKTRAINIISAARFFLFGARDIWFTVGLPVFLQSVVGWNNVEVGTFLATWVIGYGIVQASAPLLWQKNKEGPSGQSARNWAFLLATLPVAIAWGLHAGQDPSLWLVVGLIIFGAIFAINSSVHSYLILAYSDNDKVATNVGFYYMSNAAGRLVGTLLSGWIFQEMGLVGCLWWSSGFVLCAGLISFYLPPISHAKTITVVPPAQD